MKYLYSLIIFAGVLFFGCKEEKIKPAVLDSLKATEIPTQESWGSKIVFTDSGKTKAILTTGHLRMFAEAKETLLDSGVIVDFYDNNEIRTTTLTSNKGRVDDETRNLYAYENVVVKNDSGVTITTTELMWRDSDRKIMTDKFVTITTPSEKIEGYGFESDQRLKNYVIYKITYVTARGYGN